ncbi:MAG: DUF6544 family protein [Solirubrobacterales bacterium]
MSSERKMRFDPALIAGLDEPVRRYFTHALVTGCRLGAGVQLEMSGRIKVGAWLPFDAEWRGNGHSFRWGARAGPLKLLRVVDCYSDGAASMDVRLSGRLKLMHVDDDETARSGAVRAAIEGAVWSPASLLPAHGVKWRAESDDLIVASWDVPPEHPEVKLRIDGNGAIKSAGVMRWDNRGRGEHGYRPFGAIVHEERRFGDLVMPSELTVGWGFETPGWDPFFEAKILAATT